MPGAPRNSPAKAAEEVGEAWGKLSDKARASLTSMAYNYGRLPSDVAAAAQSGDEGQIAGAIRGHERDNGGVNSGRRAQEAANIEGIDLTPDKRKQAETAQARSRTRQQEQEGKPRAAPRAIKAEIANLEAKVKGKGDDLTEKQGDRRGGQAAAGGAVDRRRSARRRK